MTHTPWTPGPWTARFNGVCWQIDAEHDAVATTQFCYAPEAAANARLMALSTQLHAGLTEALDLMEGMLIGAAILHGARGTIKIEPSPEMVRLRSLLTRALEDPNDP